MLSGFLRCDNGRRWWCTVIFRLEMRALFFGSSVVVRFVSLEIMNISFSSSLILICDVHSLLSIAWQRVRTRT